MGGASSQEEDSNLFRCDSCCTDENPERRSLYGVMKTPRKPSETIRNPNRMAQEDPSQDQETSWIGQNIEVQDGVVQLADGTVLYVHEKQEGTLVTPPPGQRSKRKQLLSVSLDRVYT